MHRMRYPFGVALRYFVVFFIFCFFCAFMVGTRMAFAETRSYYLDGTVDNSLSCKKVASATSCKVTITPHEYFNSNSWNNNWEDPVYWYLQVYSSYFSSFSNEEGKLGYWKPSAGFKVQDRRVLKDVRTFEISDSYVKEHGRKVSTNKYGTTVYMLEVCYKATSYFYPENDRSDVVNICVNAYAYESESSTWYTLAGKAVDLYGNSLSEYIPDRVKTVVEGGSAIVDAKTYLQYDFKGWKIFGDGRSFEGGDFSEAELSETPYYYVQNIRHDYTVYAVYDANFMGKVNVKDLDSGSEVSTMNFRTTDKTTKKEIGCASDGCNIEFIFTIRSPNLAARRTRYTIYKNDVPVDGYDDIKIHDWYSKYKIDYKGSSADVAVIEDKIFPGQEVCYTLSFLKSGFNMDGGNYVNLKTCVKAVGGLGDVSITDALIQIKKEEQSDDEYTTDEKYVKPGDVLNYRVSYNPSAQKVSFDRPGSIKINGGNAITNSGNFNTVELFNENSGVGNWANYFDIVSSGMQSVEFVGEGSERCGDVSTNNYRCSFGIGDSNSRKIVNNYQVKKKDVGGILQEEVNINGNAAGIANPSRVRKVGDDANVIEISTGLIKGDVKAIVPYNFENTTEVRNNKGIVYAGEKAEINYAIITGLKTNDLVGGEYATIVKNAKWKLEVCYDENNNYGSCIWYDGGGGDLHEDEDINKTAVKEDLSTKTTVFVPDLPAGKKIKVKSAVCPRNSGFDGNIEINDCRADDYGSWAFSEPVELTVAKKPSFQVWGGSVYSANTVNVLMAKKWHLEGVNDFNSIRQGQPDDMYIFGSWAELSLVAEGEVRGLASGAGLGYGTTTDAGNAFQQKAIEALGGRNGSDYCLMSTLSIANSDCNSASVGNLGRSSGRSGDKSSLLSDFTEEIGTNYRVIDFGSDGFVLSGELEDFSGEEISEDGNTRVLTTKVIRTKGDVVIDKNIIYDNDGRNTTEGYSNLESIPKIIIYAKNINISCDVTRVDAVLIADDKINTCSNDVTDNSSLRSTPLMIRGSVISNTLTLGRTYGAATGKNSVVPAEIINYDTSLYLWANNQSSATAPGKLTETYINELAPRY